MGRLNTLAGYYISLLVSESLLPCWFVSVRVSIQHFRRFASVDANSVSLIILDTPLWVAALILPVFQYMWLS